MLRKKKDKFQCYNNSEVKGLSIYSKKVIYYYRKEKKFYYNGKGSWTLHKI